ncbi:capsular polysaccharide transport system permease protein [Rhodovulum imhoffii]|uniref:Capsular polysaccharide transport system permease protein n=2 Tax=Rhodovulum imhoffii TaxID=365340 RepID=A0A2T5BSS8_9RHOB|nr:capsular polysaccharide transport system permease protein [Rhodovulum imhoffii]
MKPKAKRFRIRRDDTLVSDTPAPEEARSEAPQPAAAPEQSHPGEELDAIRREELTGRQLRMARRVAVNHGLNPASDYDAVRMLRKQGIDPFQKSQMLEIVMGKREQGKDEKEERVQLPLKADIAQVPSTELDTEAARMRELRQIQIDIARRRKRRLILTAVRLFVFILLPTLVAGYYFYKIATPMYATKSDFIIQQADGTVVGGLNSMMSGGMLAIQQDSMTVQGYMQSRDAMLRIDRDIGFKSHFSQDWIDPIQRLPADASNEQTYKVYEKNVKIAYDPTEGILKMKVIAADPETSQKIANALLSYAEERVDSMTQRLREDQMSGAREGYEEAEEKVLKAQQKVLDLQERLGVFDPGSEAAALMSQINTFETEVRDKRLQLAQLMDNPRPNQARVSGLEGDIRRLESLIEELRGELTEKTDGGESLARINAELMLAEVELENRQAMLRQALEQMETARIEANRQVRYLSVAVSPVAPDEPTYPRAFENTMVSMLIFGGIYLMISLTAAILREQVSA